MPEWNSEDAKAENNAMPALSTMPETFTWQVNANAPRTCRFLALPSRLRAFAVLIQLRRQSSDIQRLTRLAMEIWVRLSAL
jgi:hypothetical protein